MPPRDLNQTGFQLARFLTRHRGQVTFLTGAGVSTDSGIPDYRGASGVYTRNPNYKAVFYQSFVTSHATRQRYWARSFIGWPMMRGAEPNATHRSLELLQRAGYFMDEGITQNVDGLHRQSEDARVIEMHGSIHHVRCLGCGTVTGRDGMQDMLAELNPSYALADLRLQQDRPNLSTTPDGDVEIESLSGALPEHPSAEERGPDMLPEMDFSSFRYPSCPSCSSGLLKPDVVFFGENLRPATGLAIRSLQERARAIVVLGSSLAVPSARRVVDAVAMPGGKVVIVNKGSTTRDEAAEVRYDGSAGEILSVVENELGL